MSMEFFPRLRLLLFISLATSKKGILVCNIISKYFPHLQTTDGPHLTPQGTCIPPSANYICDVYFGIGIAWKIHEGERDFLAFSVTDEADEKYLEYGGVQVTFRKQGSNLTSTLHIQDIGFLNNTDLTCEGVYIEDGSNADKINYTTNICKANFQ